MKLDLSKDGKTILKYLKQRAKNYPVYVNDGPGEDDDPITQITFGFQCDQAGWIALVFDTRGDAECDGEWQHYIEETWLEFPQWCDVCEALWAEDANVPIITANGKNKRFGSDDTLADVLGNCLRDLLVELRDDGGFSKLPISDDCLWVVEEHSGQYGWTSQ